MDILVRNIDFTFIEEPEEFLGDGSFVLDSGLVLKVLDYWKDKDFDIVYGAEDMDLEDEEVTIYDIDVALCVLETIMYSSTFLAEHSYADTTFVVEAYYSDIMWLLHDLAHIRYDASEGNMFVDDYSEERAIKTSVDCLKDNNLQIPYHILHEIDEAYKERFGYASHFLEYAQSKGSYAEPQRLENMSAYD